MESDTNPKDVSKKNKVQNASNEKYACWEFKTKSF